MYHSFYPKRCRYERPKLRDPFECREYKRSVQADFYPCPKPPRPKWQIARIFHHRYRAEYLKNHFTDLWKFGSPAEKYNCISLFYKLLAYVSTIEHTDYADKCKFNIIEPAVCYLKEHIYVHLLNLPRHYQVH